MPNMDVFVSSLPASSSNQQNQNSPEAALFLQSMASATSTASTSSAKLQTVRAPYAVTHSARDNFNDNLNELTDHRTAVDLVASLEADNASQATSKDVSSVEEPNTDSSSASVTPTLTIKQVEQLVEQLRAAPDPVALGSERLPAVPQHLAVKRLPSFLLGEPEREYAIAELEKRLFRFDKQSRLLAVKNSEQTIIVFSPSGFIGFHGPLSKMPWAPHLTWNGLADTIELFSNGDVRIVNKTGIFGTVTDNASTTIVLSSESNGDMVLQSVDYDVFGNLRGLAGQYVINGEVCLSPANIRIGIDAIDGIKQVEIFPNPTVAFVGNDRHVNVLRMQHTPIAGLTRVETCTNGQLNSRYSRSFATNI